MALELVPDVGPALEDVAEFLAPRLVLENLVEERLVVLVGPPVPLPRSLLLHGARKVGLGHGGGGVRGNLRGVNDVGIREGRDEEVVGGRLVRRSLAHGFNPPGALKRRETSSSQKRAPRLEILGTNP